MNPIRLRVLPALIPTDGRQIELRTTAISIQWRYVADYTGEYPWVDLVLIEDLIGPQGPAIEMRADGSYIQYRVVGAPDWINLVPLSDLIGPQGLQGPEGPEGPKGDQGDPGIGDVVGPSGAVADRIATFDGITGKLLKDGGKTIAELAPGAGSITNSILAPMATATIKGRIAAGTGDPTDLTAAQVLSLISAVRPCFRADKNGVDQTGIGNASVTFTHEVFDIGGYYDAANSRWTPPAGKVRLHTRILIAGAVADQVAYVISFRKNGVIAFSGVIRASGSGSMSMDLSEIVETNGTDYWDVNISSGGASITASGPVEYTTFSGEVL